MTFIGPSVPSMTLPALSHRWFWYNCCTTTRPPENALNETFVASVLTMPIHTGKKTPIISM